MATFIEPPPLEDDEITTLIEEDEQKAQEAADQVASVDEEATMMDQILASAQAAKKTKDQRRRQEEQEMTDSFGSGLGNTMKANLEKRKQAQEERAITSNALKEQGNVALKQGKFADAAKYYTKAIQVDPENHILYSNRALAAIRSEDFERALADSDEAIRLSGKKWAKAHVRKATALIGLGQNEEAVKCFRAAIAVAPQSTAVLEASFEKALPEAFKEYVEEKNMPFITRNKENDVVNSLNMDSVKESMKQMLVENGEWANQQLLAKIAKNPVLSKSMGDPRFAMVLQQVQQDPNAAMKRFQGDPEMSKIVTEFLNVIGQHFIEMGEQQDNQRAAQVAEQQKPHIMTKQEADLQRQADQVLQRQEIREILENPETKKVFEACGVPGGLARYMRDPVWGPRLRLLADNGLVKMEQ